MCQRAFVWSTWIERDFKYKTEVFPISSLLQVLNETIPGRTTANKAFPSDLKNAQDFGSLSADLRQKVNSVAATLNFSVVETLQKVFVENDAVFHERCITKCGPNLKGKLEEYPEIHVEG